ncbi:MAG: hypothetical protein U0441_04690 [Polyangiaceae bacterium]
MTSAPTPAVVTSVAAPAITSSPTLVTPSMAVPPKPHEPARVLVPAAPVMVPTPPAVATTLPAGAPPVPSAPVARLRRRSRR